MKSLRIALAQINPVVGDLKGNAAKIELYIEQARASGADLVSVPELALSGYPPEDLLLKPRFLSDCREALSAVAKAVSGITAVVGFPHGRNGKIYNSAAVIRDGCLVCVYNKIELPNYGVFDEKRYFTRGSGCAVLDFEGFRLMLTICEDIWIKKAAPEKWARRASPDAVLNISGSPFHAGKLEERRHAIDRFARQARAIVCYNNLVGGQDELVFDGGSMAVSASGELLAQARRFSEDLLVMDLETGLEPREREAECPGLFRVGKGAAPKPALPSRPPTPPLDRTAETYKGLVLGVRDYAIKNRFHKALVGLSGGVDSSLTAAIAVEAIGRDNVIGVTMPSHYTSDETRADAELLAGNLAIKLVTVPIARLFHAYEEELKLPLGPGGPGLEFENLQARIRGNILMTLSNRFGWLVLTTGNKSETAVGYSTLYGDTAGGFAVIKDVPKTLVYQLAAHVNASAKRQLIPQSVIDRAPTAELRPGQTDQDTLPPYPELDAILLAYVERDQTLAEIAEAGHDRRLVEEVIRMVDRNEYKRRQAPPGVKITPKAFGRDRRLPITNRYQPETRRADK